MAPIIPVKDGCEPVWVLGTEPGSLQEHLMFSPRVISPVHPRSNVYTF